MCTQHKKTKACVHIYSCMGLYEEAVALALRAGDVPLAKEHADKPPHGGGGGEEEGSGYPSFGNGGGGAGGGGDELRKRLWLMVARHLIEVEKVEVPAAMRLLEECSPLLQIEDILPFFSDFVVIDAFKQKICDSLVQYSETIQSLKREMDDFALSTSEMEKSIAALKGRHLPLTTTQSCVLCGQAALTRQFYLFPCRHAFHATCLARYILPYLTPMQRRAVEALQEQLAAEAFDVAAAVGGGGCAVGGSGERSSKRKAAQVEALQGEIDGYLAAECPWCGDVMIRTVDDPLVSEEEAAREALAWEISN